MACRPPVTSRTRWHESRRIVHCSTRIDTLTATVGGYSASIQTIQDAQASLDGKVSASYVVKTQVAANGQRYMAGIAIGVDYSGGDVTSQVLVNAGTFAVINATDGSTPATYPFVIQGNQVFISQALIGTGWITNAMIGNSIQSTAVDSQGNPLWVLDKTAGLVMRGSGSGWRTERDAARSRAYTTAVASCASAGELGNGSGHAGVRCVREHPDRRDDATLPSDRDSRHPGRKHRVYRRAFLQRRDSSGSPSTGTEVADIHRLCLLQAEPSRGRPSRDSGGPVDVTMVYGLY